MEEAEKDKAQSDVESAAKGAEEGAAVQGATVWSFAETPWELLSKGKKRAGLKKVWEALKRANQEGLVADKALDLVGPALVEAASKQGYTVPCNPSDQQSLHLPSQWLREQEPPSKRHCKGGSTRGRG